MKQKVTSGMSLLLWDSCEASHNFPLLHCSQLPAFGIISWSPWASPVSFPTSMIFPADTIFTSGFPGCLLLFSEMTSFWHQLFFLVPQASYFPSLHSLCAEAQHVVNFLIGSSASYFLIRQRIHHVSLQSHPNLQPAYNSCSYQAAAFCLRAEKLKSSVSDTHPSKHTPE